MTETTTAIRLDRFCVKFYLEDPAALDLEALIPAFHRWIQAGSVDGLLIDVADYRHVPDGPGVILIGHEADYFVDGTEGPLGLLFNRKRLAEGTNVERLQDGLKKALTACRLLEEEFGGLRFDGRRLRFVANDRLNVPNTDASLEALRPDLETVLGRLYPDGSPEVDRDATDPRSRLTVDVTSSENVDVRTLLARLG